MTDPIVISFFLVNEEGEEHDEAEIASWGEPFTDRLAPMRPLLGQLVIVQGTEELGMQDAFDALMERMCVQLPHTLATGKTEKYSYADSVGFITLTPKDGKVTVTDADGDVVAEFDLAALLDALVACAERYLAFKRREWTGDMAPMADGLANRIAEARAAIA